MKIISLNQVEKNEGLLNVLIHPSNFLVSPFRDYWQLLIVLIEKKKIFVATLSDITQWFENKRQIKLSFKMVKKKMIIESKNIHRRTQSKTRWSIWCYDSKFKAYSCSYS